MSSLTAVFQIPSGSNFSNHECCNHCGAQGVTYMTSRINPEKDEPRPRWCEDCAQVVLFHNTPVWVARPEDLEPTQKAVEEAISSECCPTCPCQ
jgi:hypothetical protein